MLNLTPDLLKNLCGYKHNYISNCLWPPHAKLFPFGGGLADASALHLLSLSLAPKQVKLIHNHLWSLVLLKWTDWYPWSLGAVQSTYTAMSTMLNNRRILVCIFGLLWLIESTAEEGDRKQRERGRVTCSKGTQARSWTRVHCRASAHGMPALPTKLIGAPITEESCSNEQYKCSCYYNKDDHDLMWYIKLLHKSI